VNRSRFKQQVKNVLLRGEVLRTAARFRGPHAVVLMYHSVVEDPRDTANTIRISQSRSSFEQQISTLARRFHVVTIEQIAEFAADGRQLSPFSVAITFDDGFADNHDVALPILSRYGTPATFYIMVNAVESGVPPWYCRFTFAFRTTTVPEWKHPVNGRMFQLTDPNERNEALSTAWDLGAAQTGEAQEQLVRGIEDSLQVEPLDARSGLMMDWEKVLAMKKAGHTIGAHTLSHPNLAHVSAALAKEEIVGSKNRLEEKVGDSVRHFSYPHPALNPQWSQQTVQITRDAGFRSAVLTTHGSVAPGDEPLSLMRIPADEDCGLWLWQLERAFVS
jgi:peptidoglycan/xylan/chitin deacetylase (PgdA/CDA1 family)